MDKRNSNSGAKAPEWLLRSRKNRARLLKAGFTGKEIEKLYIFLEGFDIVTVDWDEAATKPAEFCLLRPIVNPLNPEAGVQAAPSLEARA